MQEKFLVTGATGFLGRRVVAALLRRSIPVIATDINTESESEDLNRLLKQHGIPDTDLTLENLDISDQPAVNELISGHAVTHVISCGYQMSNLIDADPVRASAVNIVGVANLFQAVRDHNLRRLVFPSSMSVYGTSQAVFGDRAVTEEDYCGLQHHHFTYAVMKLLNEFMGKKYVDLHGISIACTRPTIIFGYGRKRSSLMWAEDFATGPALGEAVTLSFPEDNRDNWIYVDDCAEQMVLLSLKPKLNHYVYNSGGETVSGKQMAEIVRSILPDAVIRFDESAKHTPFVDYVDDTRIREELEFHPRSLKEAVRAHINEARLHNNLPLIQ